MATASHSEDFRDRARRRIRELLAGGFDGPDQIREQVAEELEDDSALGSDQIGVLIDEELSAATAARAEAQRSWPDLTDCDRLDAAFEELDAAGILARHNWTCCSNCGRAEIPDEFERLGGEWEGAPLVGYTFYHMQDVDAAVDGFGIHLNYGSTVPAADEETYLRESVRIGERVREVLERHGLRVDWDGSYAKPGVAGGERSHTRWCCGRGGDADARAPRRRASSRRVPGDGCRAVPAAHGLGGGERGGAWGEHCVSDAQAPAREWNVRAVRLRAPAAGPRGGRQTWAGGPAPRSVVWAPSVAGARRPRVGSLVRRGDCEKTPFPDSPSAGAAHACLRVDDAMAA